MRKVGLVLALLVAGAGIATAQFSVLPLDYNILGGGARAHGMGGAFIGLADDATATSWNPAGIAQLDKMEASAVGSFALKKYTFEIDINDPTIPLIANESFTSNSNHIAPNFFSFAVPVKIMNGQNNLVFAIAYQRLIDFGYDYEEDSTTYNWTYTVRGGIDAISPAVALQLTPKIMIGAAGNIIVNGLTHNSVTTSKTSSYTYDYERKYESSGFNINAGTLIQVSKNLNIGATVRLPFTITDEYSTHTEETSYADFDTTYPDQKTTYPLMIGVGLAFKPTEKLTIAADYERRNYSTSEFTWQYYNSYGQIVDTTENKGWRDINQFRVGIEYVFVGSNAVFPIRLGFRTAPLVTQSDVENTIDASTFNITNSDSAGITGMVFTGGFGMKFGNIWLDLAYEYGKSDVYRWVGNYSDNSVYKYSIAENNSNIIASCIVHF